jgi:uncharacterized protein DUF2795
VSFRVLPTIGERHTERVARLSGDGLGTRCLMDRGSTKHGPRLDEEMAQEVRGLVQSGRTNGRVEEFHDPEPAGEDQPEPGGGNYEGGAPPGMTYEEVEQRSRLGRFIPRSSLPGDREGLIVGANELNAPDDVVAQLAKLPADETFQTVNEIWAALGHHNEERRT